MKKRRARQRVSLGTLLMLLLTAAVLILCGAFLAVIAGNGPGERGEVFVSLPIGENRPKDAPPPTPAAQQNLPAAVCTADALQASPTPVPAVSTFTLSAGGTVYAPKAIRESAMEGSDHYDFEPVFAGLGDALSGADLSIVTLETTTAGAQKGYGTYNTPPQILDGLRAAGADLVSLATERALDKGYDGLALTVGELTARGMASVGVSLDGGAQGGSLFGVNGVQVAMLAYTYGLSDEGKQQTREEERAAVCQIDGQRMVDDIRQARAAGANVVIVLPHWGTKNKQETPADVRRLAVTLAEAGADIILGTHPNVVLETERLRVTRADGLEYETVVCYSLGSLLTDARAAENTAGMVAHLSVTYDPAVRRVTLGGLVCTPVYIARDRADTATVYRVVDTDNAAALAALSAQEQSAAQGAAQAVREITGQSRREEEGEG